MKRLTRRELAAAGLALSSIATAPSAVVAGGAPQAGNDPLWFIDPELRPAARKTPRIDGIPLNDSMLPVLRRGMAAQGVPPPLTSVPYEKRTIAGPPGAPELTIYVINAKAGARRGGILHMHGGGLILGSAAASLADLQKMDSRIFGQHLSYVGSYFNAKIKTNTAQDTGNVLPGAELFQTGVTTNSGTNQEIRLASDPAPGRFIDYVVGAYYAWGNLASV